MIYKVDSIPSTRSTSPQCFRALQQTPNPLPALQNHRTAPTPSASKSQKNGCAVDAVHTDASADRPHSAAIQSPPKGSLCCRAS